MLSLIHAIILLNSYRFNPYFPDEPIVTQRDLVTKLWFPTASEIKHKMLDSMAHMPNDYKLTLIQI